MTRELARREAELRQVFEDEEERLRRELEGFQEADESGDEDSPPGPPPAGTR